MRVSILRCLICCTMLAAIPTSLPAQVPQQTPAAILHSQGGVWLNGNEARDATAVFQGDLIETKPGFSASLSLDGSTVQLQPESVGKLETNLLVLDHGAVSVTTSRGFRVRVNCLTTIPVVEQWTQYEVSDLSGTVHVAARKLDVNVDHAGSHHKASAETDSRGASVHESEEKNFDETEICGAPPGPQAASSIALNPKIIGAGAGGAVALIWVLVHGGGGKTPLSTWQP